MREVEVPARFEKFVNLNYKKVVRCRNGNFYVANKNGKLTRDRNFHGIGYVCEGCGYWGSFDLYDFDKIPTCMVCIFKSKEGLCKK